MIHLKSAREIEKIRASCRIAAEATGSELCGVLAISPVISGQALIEARRAMGPDALAALRAEVPGAFDEWPAHDLALLPAPRVPAAIIVGAEDALTPPAAAHSLARWLGRCLSCDVIAGEHHCPTGTAYAESIYAALGRLLAPRP